MRSRWILAVLVASLVVGCSPSRPAEQPSSGGASAPAARPAATGPTRATVAITAEITNLASKLEPQRTYGGEYGWISNSPLAFRDETGLGHPLLATALPSRDNGTWTVGADGTMATTWTIRPNAKWHDGKPVTGRDFVFALAVYSHPLIPVREREPERFMDRVVPQDDNTFVIHWKQPYPWADVLFTRQFEALPEHMMGSVFEAGDMDAFLNHSFWTTTSYVGNGPFRLVQWEPATSLTYRAFDDYFMGRPKIDELIVKIIPDANTMVSNVLSGAIDGTLGVSLGVNQVATIRNQWAQTGEGQVKGFARGFRFLQIQFDPARSMQPALTDLRVRRAIVSGLDRDSLAEAITEGASKTAEAIMPPTDPLYARLEQAITRYPFDPTRAAAYLQEAGWNRTPDGLFSSAGQRFTLDIRDTAGQDSELEANIVADHLSSLGMQMTQTIVPSARIADVEYRVTFPGLNGTGTPIDIPAAMNIAHGDQCATVERRYVGVNRGCWINPEYDRFYIIASSSLDPSERENAVIEAHRVLTDQVGLIGVAYTPETVAVRKGLVGPGVHWPAQVGTAWNVHTWRWEQ